MTMAISFSAPQTSDYMGFSLWTAGWAVFIFVCSRWGMIISLSAVYKPSNRLLEAL